MVSKGLTGGFTRSSSSTILRSSVIVGKGLLDPWAGLGLLKAGFGVTVGSGVVIDVSVGDG